MRARRHGPASALTALTVLTVLGLAGCATVGPDYHLPASAIVNRPGAGAPFLGAAAAPFSGQPLPPQWWRLYQDPQLDRLVEQAFAANTDLRVAAANLRRAHGALQETRTARLPAVEVSATPFYGRPSATAAFLPDRIPDTWGYDAGVSVSYQLDLFGKIARAVEAAGADAQSVQAGYDLARISVAAAVTGAYVDVCAAGHEQGVARLSIALQRQFVDATERRVRAGRGSPLDVSRARSQLEQLNASLPPLQARQGGAAFRLAVLTGELPGALAPAIAACAAEPQLTATIPVGDGAALLRRRPDVRQAERMLAAATARIGVATADLYPSISLGLSAGSTGTIPQFGDGNASRWSVGPLLSWTVPVSGSTRLRIAQAGASADAALAHFDGAVLTALREVETALAVYAKELDRNAALKAARQQSALAASQARALQRAGRTDFLSALDAERTLASADGTLAASDAQLATDQVSLFLALGGGWETAPDVRRAVPAIAPR